MEGPAVHQAQRAATRAPPPLHPAPAPTRSPHHGKKPTPERLCWRMTFTIESGKSRHVLHLLSPKTLLFLVGTTPDSSIPFIRQQSPESPLVGIRPTSHASCKNLSD